MWTVEDHTADVRLRVEAADWPALLAEAVVAFAGWVSAAEADGAAAARTVERPVEVTGADAAATWVRWWRALHRLWTVEGLLPVEAHRLEAPEPTSARAVVRCLPAEALDAARCADVKAVTWHGAEAGPGGDGLWRGRIVLDI